MTFTIGGFSKEQYESYLNSPLKKGVWKSDHWVGRFNLARYPIIAIFINRLAYFVLHGFKVYLSNASLFNKFKTHDFTKIETQEHYQIALDLFKKFQASPGIDPIDLEIIKDDLDSNKEFAEKKLAEKPDSKPTDGDLLNEEEEKPKGENKENLKDQQSANGNPLTPVLPVETDKQKASKLQQDAVEEGATPHNAAGNPVDGAQPSIIVPEAGFVLPGPPKIVFEPIPENIQAIIDQSFPLSDLESIQDLYKNLNIPANRKRLSLYRKNLFILHDFERKLRKENKQTNADFAKYMQKIDQAHERACKQAIEDAPALHAAFLEEIKKPKEIFDANGVSTGKWDYAGEKPVKFKENGEIVCSFRQYEWVKDQISKKYRAIYDLSFDATQERRMTRLVQLILGGEAAHNQKTPLFCQFIRLEEADTPSTPVVHSSSTGNNPFTKRGSYIFTQFIGKDNLENLQQKINQLSESFVKYWLQKKGTTLKLPGVTIQSGPASEGVKAADWVEQVRNAYTQYLKGLNPNQLKKLIDNTFNCPLVQAIINDYEEQIDPVDGVTSHFPKSIMEKVLKEQLQKAQGNVLLKQAIQKTIDQSTFADPKDIEILSKTSGYLPSYIEPLIRIRVLYLMTCLGDSAVNSVVNGIKQRSDALYDPAVCDDPEEPSLLCDWSKEKVFEFDQSLDRLDLKAVTILADPIKVHPVGQVESTIQISSIHQKNSDTTFVEMQNLALSIHASKAQSHFLLSQFSPKMLFLHVSELMKEIENLIIVKNAAAYQQAKQAAEGSWTKLWKSFDSAPYYKWDHDKSELVRLCRKAQLYVSYLSTQKILDDKKQLETFKSKPKENFNIQAEKIRADLKGVYQLFNALYGKEMNGENSHAKKCKDYVQKLGQLYSMTSDDLAAVTTDDDKKTLEDDSENSLSIEEKEAIQKVSQDTLGDAFNQSRDVKFIQGNIQYFEALINGMKENILAYIEKEEFPEIEAGGKPKIDRMIATAEKKQDQWLETLLPILNFCKKTPNTKPDRFNADYLVEVGKAWKEEFLLDLRKAAKWAKDHPTMPGAQHIDAICYLFYTRFNKSLAVSHNNYAIYKAYMEFADKALNETSIQNEQASPNTSSYDLICDLQETNKKIKAALTDTKVPHLPQLGNGMVGHLTDAGITSFDPNAQSHPPHVLFDTIIEKKEGDKQGFHYIGMGSPTIETGKGSVEINDEFLGYLRACKRNNAVHLYVNHQNFIPNLQLGKDESVCCQALHDLANNEFKDTLFVITLSHNSPFYEQQGHKFGTLHISTIKKQIVADLLDGASRAFKNFIPEHMKTSGVLREWLYQNMEKKCPTLEKGNPNFASKKIRDDFVEDIHKDLQAYMHELLKTCPSPDGKKVGLGYTIYDHSSSKFKNELIDQLLNHSQHVTGNHLPEDIVAKLGLREWSKHAVNQIHQTLFKGSTKLTAEERRFFISMFYNNLSWKILIETNARHCNRSFKEWLDWSAVTAAEENAYLSIANNGFKDADSLSTLCTKMLVFSPTWIMGKRGILEECFEHMTETVKFMLGNQKEIQKLQATLFPNIKITRSYP